jgi:outer membrane murein-binding lipoprotein Lpp
LSSPLQYYNETAKQFGITDKKQIHIRQKLAFASEQVQQMQAVANRLLFDIASTKCHLETAKDDNSRAAYEGKLREYERDLRQMAASLDYAIQIEDELNVEFKKSGEEV